MRPLVRGARALWRVLWRSKQLDADMQKEMHLHLQVEAHRLAQAHGLDPEEARRQAFVRFGGVEKYKAEGREARGLDLRSTRFVASVRYAPAVPSGVDGS